METTLKKILGIISIIFGIVSGLYVGLWWAFIGGIIQLVDAFNSSPIVGKDIAVGFARVFLATTVGELIAGLFIMAGITLIGFGFKGKRRSR
ncbi:hypothetical protein D3C76_02080 [compost metagenome]